MTPRWLEWLIAAATGALTVYVIDWFTGTGGGDGSAARRIAAAFVSFC